MSEDPKVVEYRHLASNETLKGMLDELEKAAFDRFMGLPIPARYEAPGQASIARIEAVREIRRELDFRAKHSVRVVKPVV